MVQDKLQLNDAKTEFLIIGTRAQLNKVMINDLQVGEAKVSAVYSVRNLGVWFDANMNMITHINNICQAIYYHLHNIRRIRKYLSYDNRKTIVQAIAMFLVTSPIVINVPTRGLLAVETMQAIVRWLANLNIKRNMTSMFVNKKHRYYNVTIRLL